MTDESAAPTAPDPVPTPATPPAPARPPAGVRPGMRPPPRKAPAGPKPPSKLKAYLVIGIIVSSVLLVGAIGWRLYVKLTTKPGIERNVKKEWDATYQKANDARKAIFALESKAWVENRELTAEEIGKIKDALKTLENSVQSYHELHALAREQGLKQGTGATAETQEMEPQLVYLKTWIWDANGVIDSKPPEYGGLNIPHYRAILKQDKSAARLKELWGKQEEIVTRRDPEEIGKAVAEIKGLRDAFAAVIAEADRLHGEVRQGLTMPDLRKADLEYLGDLERLQSEAQMSLSEARNLISKFPRPEDLVAPEPPKEEPKEAPPKEEPPKETPPKETPPKEEPPPKEQPPKEEPPKDPPKESR